MNGTAFRLALVADSLDEGWPSMDLCADELYAALVRHHPNVRTELLRFSLPGTDRGPSGPRPRLLGRIAGRYGTYPLRLARRRFDAFHLVDHSYAHLALGLPGARTGVYLHDLDAFAPLDDPAGRFRGARPPELGALRRRAFAWAARAGVERAAIVFHNSAFVGAQAEAAGLAKGRLVHAPLGAASEYGLEGPRRDRVEGRPYVLHVGSDLPRKRIDVLLRAFAVLRRKRPELCLAQRGARPREAQAALVRELGLEDAIVDLPRLRRDELAAHYRGARAVLLSSDAEGFGLPVIEALACGAPVACTDIPAFREVGGPVVHRAPAGEPEALARAALDALATVDDVEVRAARSAWAARTSWEAHAARIARAYGELLGRRP